jgi:hypothetical protein
MKNFKYLLFAIGSILIINSCATEQLEEQEVLNTAFATTVTSCEVIDADRCGSFDYNFWWSPPQWSFGASNWFKSTTDHQLTFTEYNDGTANIAGTTTNGTCVVVIDVWLKDKKTWVDWSADGGDFKAEGCSEAIAEDMNYYVIDSSLSTITSTGSDCLGEGTFTVEQRPDPSDLSSPNYGVFVGAGGALWDTNVGARGLSGWGWILNEAGERAWVMDFNFRIACETPPQDCGPCDGKVSELSLQYNGDIADANIVVKQKKDDVIVFDDTVQPNGIFSFSGQDKKNTLGTEIIVYVNGVENARLHTSCSKPIGPGVTAGDFEVTDGSSRNGGKLCPEDTPPNSDDCSECDGKVTDLVMQYNGSADATIVVEQKKDGDIVFDATVMAGQSFSFTGTDKKGTLGTEIIIYVNGVENTRIHTSCSKPIGPGLVSGDFEVLEGASQNGGELCPVEDETTPPNNDDCSECDGKITNLDMQFNSTTAATIVVEQKKDGAIVFDDMVGAGESFSFSGTDKKGTLGTEITIYVDGVENTRIHTSCSVPVGPGLVSGDFEVLGGASLNGGELCAVENTNDDDDNHDDDNDDDDNDDEYDANCECDGKATYLTLKYNGDSEATVRVLQKKDNVVVFDDQVGANGSFTFNGVDKKGTLGTEIIIYVNGVENTRIHTSCSVPLFAGFVSGDFEILAGASRNGGEFCPAEGGSGIPI